MGLLTPLNLRAAVVLAAALAAAAPAAHAQDEAAVVRRASELRATPAADGAVAASLPADSQVTRLGDRQGPWVKVKAASGATGWLHMFDLRSPGSTGDGSGGGTMAGALRGVTGFFSKAPEQKTTTPTATIGIRGLGAEDLAQAQPDLQAVTRMEKLRASEADAQRFAKQANLAPVNVEPLPAPAPATAIQSGVTQ
ncbi:SH3 domain-containing protein [Ramlibacter humi]|uniref:SH3 domain-containing protein n=1 Tax=Ramlibacter humi TaxID=2530451 RepID=A0A4Z0BJ55_9BURK|nr:SH3 domain-containing protein [Ramlibacter humi]TFY98297.1 SH3 domain-containing protein [Ramlibacter humi]